MLLRCTLTGVEPDTDLDALCALGDAFPFAEFGVLFSFSRAGHGRYPSIRWIRTLARSIERTGDSGRWALHLCGSAVDDYLAFNPGVHQVTSAFGRVQLNLKSSIGTDKRIRAAIHASPGQILITQHNATNSSLAYLLCDEPTHWSLCDSSGGRGQEPLSWPAPIVSGKPFGYAGGIGPPNLERHLSTIQSVVGGLPYWVDMESKLRDADDRFDLTAAQRCLEIAASYTQMMTKARSALDG